MNINAISTNGYGGTASIAAARRALDARLDLPPDTKKMAAVKVEAGMPADAAIYTSEKELGKPVAGASFKDILRGKMGG
ncbi:MAG: hypothetical protein FWC23_02220 [Chitinispirillia bacterium]|nr:hypothetical protein [Chitinispirillia bacterium]MCL2267995.1 hypothetical protein [Chitinispirillia bacterium]